MEFEVLLYKPTTKASDKSVIPRSIMEEYLASTRYKEAIEKHQMMGGITHKSRHNNVRAVGTDDGILLDNNSCFYITSIFFKEDGNCYATAKVFNPDDFSGEHRDNINTVVGFLRSGVYLPISLVINGEWNSKEVCTYIDSILGFDLTLNNSFPDAGVTKVFSKSNLRSFSTGEVNNILVNDIAPQCLLEDLDFLKDYESLEDKTDEVKLKAFADSYIKKKYFTYDVNLVDRMIMINKPLFSQFYLLCLGYSRYYRMRKASINNNPANFKRMFMSDFSQIILKGMYKIKQNQSPAIILGMMAYSDDIVKAMEEFTHTHYRNMLLYKSAGFLPRNRIEDEYRVTTELYNAVMQYITDGELSITKADNIILI